VVLFKVALVVPFKVVFVVLFADMVAFNVVFFTGAIFPYILIFLDKRRTSPLISTPLYFLAVDSLAP